MAFIERDGTRLVTAGERFALRGANNYYLAFVDEPTAAAVLDFAVSLGLNTLRISAFQEVPGGFYWPNARTGWPELQAGIEGLDRAVRLAKSRGIRLILPLTNNWPDFGGMTAYTKWFGLGGKDQFYVDGRCRAAYWQYVEQLIERYRDEETILAWELANEPECALESGVEILLSWIWEMASLIKGKDPNHLVAVGDQGYFRRSKAGGNWLYNGSCGVSCEEFLGVAPVDFGTFHMYEPMASSERLDTFGERWIREHVEAGARASKPMLLEEFGARIGRNGVVDAEDRAQLYGRWLDVAEEAGAAGALLWMIGLPKQSGQPFDLDPYAITGGPEAELLRRRNSRG